MYTLAPYNYLDKRRAILGPGGHPVAFVDYDDVAREDADKVAEAALRGLNTFSGQELFITGMLDEVEFMGQRPAEHGINVHGLFTDEAAAVRHARTLSTDPHEAVVVPVTLVEAE